MHAYIIDEFYFLMIQYVPRPRMLTKPRLSVLIAGGEGGGHPNNANTSETNADHFYSFNYIMLKSGTINTFTIR